MTTHLAVYIKKVFSFLRKKKDFSFLNAAGVLLLVGVILTTLLFRQVIQYRLGEDKKTFLTNTVYRDLTYIKPFTSLVGFNWKFGKDNKRATKETRSEEYNFFLPHIKPF